MHNQWQNLLLLAFLIASSCASDRANSKRLEWQDRSNSKRLRWDEDPDLADSAPKTKGERGLTFINNEAYSLSRKHQKLMWDLYLRKGYAPSFSDYDENDPYADLTPSSSGYRAGTATLVDPSTDILYASGENMIGDYGAEQRPDVVASRILDHYELSKSPRGVPEVENEIVSSALVMRSTSDPSFENTEPPAAADKLTSESGTSATSLLSYLWDLLRENLGELLGREMQETILNTLWSWWTSIVEFVNAAGKRALEGRALHSVTST